MVLASPRRQPQGDVASGEPLGGIYSIEGVGAALPTVAVAPGKTAFPERYCVMVAEHGTRALPSPEVRSTPTQAPGV